MTKSSSSFYPLSPVGGSSTRFQFNRSLPLGKQNYTHSLDFLLLSVCSGFASPPWNLSCLACLLSCFIIILQQDITFEMLLQRTDDCQRWIARVNAVFELKGRKSESSECNANSSHSSRTGLLKETGSFRTQKEERLICKLHTAALKEKEDNAAATQEDNSL